MSAETDSLGELYREVTGGEILVESQEESPSHEPIRGADAEFERAVWDVVERDGLEDAVEGAENG
jgi:hypothetical protein